MIIGILLYKRRKSQRIQKEEESVKIAEKVKNELEKSMDKKDIVQIEKLIVLTNHSSDNIR